MKFKKGNKAERIKESIRVKKEKRRERIRIDKGEGKKE